MAYHQQEQPQSINMNFNSNGVSWGAPYIASDDDPLERSGDGFFILPECSWDLVTDLNVDMPPPMFGSDDHHHHHHHHHSHHTSPVFPPPEHQHLQASPTVGYGAEMPTSIPPLLPTELAQLSVVDYSSFDHSYLHAQRQALVMEPTLEERLYRNSLSGSSCSGDTNYSIDLDSGSNSVEVITRSNSVESTYGSGSSGNGDGPLLHQPHYHHHHHAHAANPNQRRVLVAPASASMTAGRRRLVNSGATRARGTGAAAAAREEQSSPERSRRKRKRFSQVQKIETHMTRLEGACLRCWKNRKRCIKVEGACCKYCNTLLDSIPNIPCFRSRLSSSELFRKGPTDEFCWTRRRWLQTPFNDTKVWRSQQKRLLVTQGMGLKLELLVKQYEPQPEDQGSYTWIDKGKRVHTLEMPRYAVADIGKAQEAIDRYVGDYTEPYIGKKIGSEDTIPWKTFQMALKLSNDGSSLLRNTLRLWTASRIIEDPWEITGGEKLGMTPNTDPGCPYYQKVPVTPVMDFQIDHITIHKILLPLKKNILQELQKKVLENRRKDFLEIFLTMYILLHNIELTIAHDRWFAQRWDVKTRFSHYELIDNVFLGANIMLTHFHYVTKGYAAFGVDWKKSSAADREVQKKFMDDISTAAKHQASSLRMLKERKQYESPMFWCSQLFYDGWKPVQSPCAAAC